MNIRFRPSKSYTPQEIRAGGLWLEADVTCRHCDKVQPVAATGSVGGPCVRCGRPTCAGVREEEEAR